jgi:P4 family phage/plasmid primase-like protien
MADEFPSAPPGSSVARLVESLYGLGCEYAGSVSGHTGKFTCPNPGHTDGRASFDVRVGRNGKAAFNCSPCASGGDRAEWIEVLREAGVDWSGNECDPEDVDWGPAADLPGGGGGEKKDWGPEVGRDVYTYRFKDGRLNFKVARINYESGAKRFVVRHVGKDGKVVWSLPPSVIRTPLGLENFAEWPDGTVVYLVEGEKAATALLKHGVKATTFHGGTNAPRHPRWAEWFKRFRVAVWPDADEVGVEWAKSLVLELRNAGVSAEMVAVVSDAVQASDDAYDAIERDALGDRRRLTKGDLKRLAALKPKPVIERAERPARPRETVEYNGREVEIVSASAAGSDGGSGEVAPRAPAYPYAINVAPYAFAKEVLRREWGLGSDEGLTLRWQAAEGTFWLWEPAKGHYVPLHPDEVRAQVVDRLDRVARETVIVDKVSETRPVNMKPKNTEDIIKGFQTAAIVSPYGAGRLLPALGGVPFRNGWLDAATGVLTPLGPSRDVRWVVPADYDPSDAEAPAEWIKFLASLGFDDLTEEYRLLRQWFGYLLSGRVDLHKGLILVGPKRAGKGTVLRIAEELMGEGAAATTLERFDPQKTFGLSNLIGKSLATIGDARWGKNDTGRNAAILTWTGGDMVPMEEKNKAVRSVRASARLMIASNEPPRFYEASDALATRMLILEFTKSFYNAEDHGLASRLISELPLIARWSLDGLADLEREGRFSETAKGLEIQRSVARDASPAARFVEECCEVGQYKEDKDNLWAEYKAWADDENVFAGTKSAFFSNLNTSFPGKFRAVRSRDGSHRKQQIAGIKFVGDRA